MSEARGRAGRASPFQSGDFARLWLIGCVAFVVRWLEMLAVGLYAYQITGSAFLVAMLSMLRVLPMGLFGAFLGVASERIERRSPLEHVDALQRLRKRLLDEVLGVAQIARPPGKPPAGPPPQGR